MTIKKILGSSIVLALVLVSATALAERKNPLEGQPAIRHRHELRNSRFEVGPSFTFSIDRALRHSITFGLKLEYHLNDYFSVGADFGYGIGVDTGLTGELERQYAGGQTFVRTGCPSSGCTFEQMKDQMSNIQLAGDVRVAFTPIVGKLGIFSKAFMDYDLYAFVGVGLANLINGFEGNAEQDAVSSGFRAGPSFGVGMHIFILKFFSMGIEVKDLIFLDNEPGGDATRGLSDAELPCVLGGGTNCIKVDGDDRKFYNHWYAGVNFTFFLPTKVINSR
jgi:outer membrane beta-barrel protein